MPVTDLAEKLDLSKRQRLMQAIRNLPEPGFRDLMISLMGGMGVRVQSAQEQRGTLVIYGQGEEGYLVLAARTDFTDPELIVRSLVEEARSTLRTPVFMTLQSLDPGTLNYLERESVSFAAAEKFLALLEKFELDEQLLAGEDLKVLEDRGEPCLPSVCKLEALLEEAEERRNKGDHARAVQVLDQALEIKPLNDSLWLKKASYLLEMGRPAEALAAANRAAELRSGDAGTWFLIALIQEQLGDRERELAAYDNVLRINPNHVPAILNKGAALYDLGRLEWAFKVFNDLTQRFPQEPRGWNNRGLVLKAMGRLVEAQASFERSSMMDPDFADPLINIARLREERGDMEGAVEGWKDVLRLVDSRADIWAHLGTCLRGIGQLEDALTALDRALYLEPALELVRQERERLAAEMGLEEEEPRVNEEDPAGTAASAAAVAQDNVPPEERAEATEEADSPGAPAAEDAGVAVQESGSEAPEARSATVPATLPEPRSLQELGETAVEEVHALPPAEVDRQTAVMPVEEVRAVEPVPEPGRLVEMEEAKPLAAPAPPATPEAAPEPDSVEPPVEGKAIPAWPFEVSLPPLPEGGEALRNLEALLLLSGGEREMALQLLVDGMSDGPDLEGLRLKARALLSLGRGEEAAEVLKEAFRRWPEDARTALDLEALYHRYGGEGGRLLRAVDCSEARSRRALELLENGQYNELSRMDVRGQELPVRLAKALALMRLGRYRDASKLLKALISEFPAFPEGLDNLGVCMRFMGEYDYDQAIHFMELAMEVDPHHSEAMNNIGCTLFASGGYERAIEVLKAAVDEDRRPEYLLNLSNVQMALGDTEGAKQSLTSALKMEESADVLYMLGVIAEGEKQYRWAHSLYQDALEKAPGFREAQAGRDRTKVLAKG